MASVLAIVSKAIFERDAKIGGKVADVGTVVPFERYASKNKALDPASGGALFLVTVRPPDEKLWLVAILESPTFDGDEWKAKKNTVPITDITSIKGQIKFTSGVGISAKKGALGMSLQTPRILSDEDEALLRGGGPAPAAAAGAKGSQVAGAAGAAVKAVSSLTGRGHLNAHEKGGPTPCLCRKCIDRSPERFTIPASADGSPGMTLFRDRAEGKQRFLWYWVPESLEGEREAVRRAVQAKLLARPTTTPSKDYQNLDKVFGGKGKGKRKAADDDDGDDE